MLETLIKFADGEICQDNETGFLTYAGITANRIYHKINELRREKLFVVTEAQILLNFCASAAIQNKRKEAKYETHAKV